VNDILTLPDGTQVGTGLQLPTSTSSVFPAYKEMGPMLTDAQVEAVARSGAARGRDRFDASFIKNQRSHGSCQGFASAAAVTRARIRRGLPRVDLSGAYAYSLVNGGRDRGSLLEDGLEACHTKGYATEATVGWDQIYRTSYDFKKADAEAARFRAFEVFAVRSERELLSAVASGFDVVVAVHADDKFMRLDARGVAGGGDGPGNHAVGVDGLWWADGIIVLDAFNSWGTSYGDAGRMGLVWSRHLAPTTKFHVFYCLRSALDDPQGDSPPPAVTP
jgi:hypothetical protein